MHKLIEYVCDELEELEHKADKNGLSSSEIQYADTLAHLKKNLLKADELWDDSEYSNDGGMSYARGGRGRGGNVRRDAMGRYSREGNMSYRGGSYRGYSRDDVKDEMVMKLKDMEQDADDEHKHMIKKWIKQIEES